MRNLSIVMFGLSLLGACGEPHLWAVREDLDLGPWVEGTVARTPGLRGDAVDYALSPVVLFTAPRCEGMALLWDGAELSPGATVVLTVGGLVARPQPGAAKALYSVASAGSLAGDGRPECTSMDTGGPVLATPLEDTRTRLPAFAVNNLVVR